MEVAARQTLLLFSRAGKFNQLHSATYSERKISPISTITHKSALRFRPNNFLPIWKLPNQDVLTFHANNIICCSTSSMHPHITLLTHYMYMYIIITCSRSLGLDAPNSLNHSDVDLSSDGMCCLHKQHTCSEWQQTGCDWPGWYQALPKLAATMINPAAIKTDKHCSPGSFM